VGLGSETSGDVESSKRLVRGKHASGRDFHARAETRLEARSDNARGARISARAAKAGAHSIESGMFMMMRRNSLNTIGLSGLVKKSAVLFAVRTNGTVISNFSTMSRT
jgi:hypothetical protein